MKTYSILYSRGPVYEEDVYLFETPATSEDHAIDLWFESECWKPALEFIEVYTHD